MGNTTRPRRKYRPKPVVADPLALAMRRASKIPPAERAEVMAQIHASFKALREGVATEMQWVMLASTIELGLAVERLGVVKGILGHLQAAEAALAAIYKRGMATGTWCPTALYWQEIDSIDTAVWLHESQQLANLSEREWRQAHDRAVGVVRSDGGRAVATVDQLPPEQLQLLGARA
jgi:hypothetical protein